MPCVHRFESMGTTWEVHLGTAEKNEIIVRAIERAAYDFDHLYSRFKETSLVCKMAAHPGLYTVPKDLVRMLRLYESLYLPSDKRFTPCVGRLVESLGYDSSYSFVEHTKIEGTPFYEHAVRIIGEEKVSLEAPVLLDIGALGKGYFIDIAAAMIESHGVTSYMINGGGDIRLRSTEAAIIGLENPALDGTVVGTATITHGALCGSSGNRRTWGSYHHIINPHTQHSPTEIIATWAYAPQAAIADALATFLFLAPPEHIPREYHNTAWAYIDAQGGAHVSAGFPGEFFSS